MPVPLPLLCAFFLSGAAGLVYEVVWARQLAVLVGGTAVATQAVLATFFVGLSLGAFLVGRRAAAARSGTATYARLELGIAGGGLWSLLLLTRPGLFARFTDGSAGPATAAVAFAVTLLACLPATLLMGATFPAVARAFEQAAAYAGAGPLLGWAYAANTFGAAAGSLAGAFVALPTAGVRGTLVLAVGLNLGAAALAFVATRAAAPVAAAGRAPGAQGEAAPSPAAWAIKLALALGGFAAISLQIVALRILAVTLSDTVYTFALAVAAYIAGAAAAAAVLGQRPALFHWPPALTLAAATLLSALWLLVLPAGAHLNNFLVGGDDAGFATLVAGEAAVALLLAAPAAVPTTWVFLALAAQPVFGGAGRGARAASAWNGLGCAAAPFVSALLVLPRLGTLGLAALSLAALALATALVARAPAAAGTQPALAYPLRVPIMTSGRISVGLVAAALLPLLLLRGGLHGWTVTPGWQIVWTAEGASATVSVEQSPQGLRRLRTNNNFSEGGDAGGISQLRQGMLPTLLRPDAGRVLVLGVGSGITLAGVVAGLPEARFDAVELVPEIGRALGFFARSNGGVAQRANVRLHVADARAFAAHAAATGQSYDLVVGELFHASQAGTGALYAAEHFRAVARLIQPGGLYAQWLPLHEVPPGEAKAIVRTFFRVFPQGGAFLGTWTVRTPILGLVGAHAPLAFDWDAIAAQLQAPPERAARAAASELAALDVTLAGYLGDAARLRAWAGEGPENTDDHPALELGAPRGRGPWLGARNVMALLPIWQHPDFVRWGDPRRSEAVARARAAVQAYLRGSQAIAAGDLDAAERALREAVEQRPDLAFPAQALADLARVFDSAGARDRGSATRAWLASKRPHPAATLP